MEAYTASPSWRDSVVPTRQHSPTGVWHTNAQSQLRSCLLGGLLALRKQQVMASMPSRCCAGEFWATTPPSGPLRTRMSRLQGLQLSLSLVLSWHTQTRHRQQSPACREEGSPPGVQARGTWRADLRSRQAQG